MLPARYTGDPSDEVPAVGEPRGTQASERGARTEPLTRSSQSTDGSARTSMRLLMGRRSEHNTNTAARAWDRLASLPA